MVTHLWCRLGLHGRIFVHLSTSVHIFKISMVRRPCSSTVHLRPSITNNGPLSESVHEVDVPCSKIRPLVHLKIIILVRCPNMSMRWTVWAQNLGPLSTWTGGRMAGPQTLVFVRGGLMSVTEILARNHDVGDFFRYVSDFLNVLNRSPISQTCHQHNLVSNIRHQHSCDPWNFQRCSRIFENLSKTSCLLKIYSWGCWSTNILEMPFVP